LKPLLFAEVSLERSGRSLNILGEPTLNLLWGGPMPPVMGYVSAASVGVKVMPNADSQLASSAPIEIGANALVPFEECAHVRVRGEVLGGRGRGGRGTFALHREERAPGACIDDTVGGQTVERLESLDCGLCLSPEGAINRKVYPRAFELLLEDRGPLALRPTS
jgi:hypothetical protein